ncbi:MAG: NrdH-redoxin [Methanotrichaceae archaeon]|nr:NrdH-redoxin [Methanotrichaceae archaeon]
MIYKVYSTKACHKCEQLKSALISNGIEFKSLDMSTPEVLTELRVNGVFTLSAPVLQVDNGFYMADDLFDGERLKDLGSMGIFS